MTDPYALMPLFAADSRCRSHRKCDQDQGLQGIYTPRSSDFRTCETSWVRVTGQPVPDANRTLIDESIRGIKGFFYYVVRPVAADGTEGPVGKVLQVNLTPGFGPSHCYEADSTSSDGFPIINWVDLDDDPLGERFQINNAVKGTASPVGAPATPALVNMAWDEEWDEGPSPMTGMEKSRQARVYWLPNQESDLAGYHVEMAGSSQGPWQRLTSNPVAWWETEYRVQGLGIWDTCDGVYTGHTECMRLRVIAVDAGGNESIPSAAAPSDPDCGPGATVAAPLNLTAESWNDPGITTYGPCQTKLSWDAVPGADEYYVYRFPYWAGFYAYRTHVVAATPGAQREEYVEAGDPSNGPFLSDCNVHDLDAYCPIHDPGQVPLRTCTTDGLQAYYVTARRLGEGESPASNMVFWDCGLDPGYARLDLDRWSEPYGETMLVSLEPGDLPREFFDDRVCVQPAPVAPASVLASRSTPPHAGDAPRGLNRPRTLDTAGLVVLGSNPDPNPPWELFDLHTDHLGSVRVVTDDAGVVTALHDFLPFGEEVFPILDHNTHLFTGHESDGETGLTQMLARYHASAIGRFISVDPIVSLKPRETNAYAYVTNNPLLYDDPTGEYRRFTIDSQHWGELHPGIPDGKGGWLERPNIHVWKKGQKSPLGKLWLGGDWEPNGGRKKPGKKTLKKAARFFGTALGAILFFADPDEALATSANPVTGLSPLGADDRELWVDFLKRLEANGADIDWRLVYSPVYEYHWMDPTEPTFSVSEEVCFGNPLVCMDRWTETVRQGGCMGTGVPPEFQRR